MNRLVSVILLLAALSAWTALAQAQHPPGHGASSPPPGKKADDLDQPKGPTTEPIQKEGKVTGNCPGTPSRSLRNATSSSGSSLKRYRSECWTRSSAP